MKESEFEFRQRWASVSGKVSALNGIINIIKEDAGKAFVAEKMEVAEYALDLAKRIEAINRPYRQELNECIAKESK